MEEEFKQIDLTDIQEIYDLYSKDLKRLNHFKELLKECEISMNDKAHLTINGCILKNNLGKLECISNNRVHQVKGYFGNNHEIKKLIIDNNELDSSCLKNPKYYNILFEREKEKLKKVIVSLTSIIVFLSASISFSKLFYIAAIVSASLSIKNIHEYINDEQVGSYFCGKLTRIRLNKFQQYLENDFEYEKERSIENYNYNMSFLATKKEILNSMIAKQEKRVSDDILKIKKILNINDNSSELCKIINIDREKENTQKAYQFVKKASFN